MGCFPRYGSLEVVISNSSVSLSTAVGFVSEHILRFRAGGSAIDSVFWGRCWFGFETVHSHPPRAIRIITCFDPVPIHPSGIVISYSRFKSSSAVNGEEQMAPPSLLMEQGAGRM